MEPHLARRLRRRRSRRSSRRSSSPRTIRRAESLLGWAQMLQREVRRRAAELPEGADARAAERAGAHQRRLHLPQEADLRRGHRASVQGHPARTTTRRRRCTRTSISGSCTSSARCTRTPQTFFRKTLALGPNLIEAYFELGPRLLVQRPARGRDRRRGRRACATNKFNPWGKRCAEMLATVEAGGAPSR